MNKRAFYVAVLGFLVAAGLAVKSLLSTDGQSDDVDRVTLPATAEVRGEFQPSVPSSSRMSSSNAGTLSLAQPLAIGRVARGLALEKPPTVALLQGENGQESLGLADLSRFIVAQASCNEAGHFVLTGVPARSPSRGYLVIYGNGIRPLVMPLDLSEESTPVDVGAISLSEGAAVQARVIRANGAVLQGANIHARLTDSRGGDVAETEVYPRVVTRYLEDTVWTTNLDATGSFHIAGLPIAAVDIQLVVNQHVDTLAQAFLLERPVNDLGTITIPVHEDRSVTVQSPGNEPLANARVIALPSLIQSSTVQSECEQASWSALTDDLGKVMLQSMSEGAYSLAIWHDGYWLYEAQLEVPSAAPLVVTLEPGAHVKLTVYDSVTGDAISDASVSAELTDASNASTAASLLDPPQLGPHISSIGIGEFEITGISRPSMRLVVDSPAHQPAVVAVHELAPGETREARAALVGLCSLVVQVVDQAGKAAVNAKVVIVERSNPDNQVAKEGQAASNGTVAFSGVYEGTWTVTVYAPQATKAVSHDLHLGPGCIPSRSLVQVIQGGTLEAAIEDNQHSNDKEYGWAIVLLLPEPVEVPLSDDLTVAYAAQPANARVVEWGSIAAGIPIRSRLLFPGRYACVISRLGVEHAFRVAGDMARGAVDSTVSAWECEVRPGETVRLTCDLGQDGRIYGSLRPATTGRIGLLALTSDPDTRDKSLRIESTVEVASDGAFDFPNLFPGTYLLVAWATEAALPYFEKLSVDAGSAERVDIELGRAEVVGRVVDFVSGKGVPQLRVSTRPDRVEAAPHTLYRAGIDPEPLLGTLAEIGVAWCETDKDGVFVLQYLENGSYTSTISDSEEYRVVSAARFAIERGQLLPDQSSGPVIVVARAARIWGWVQTAGAFEAGDIVATLCVDGSAVRKCDVTDGKYTFSGIVPGNYDVRVTDLRKKDVIVEKHVEIKGAEEARLDFRID